MQLTIENVKTNPSGKSCVVKAGGKDYFAKPAMGLAVGMTIEAETEVSEYNGKQNVWIKTYKKVGNGNGQPAAPQTQNGSGDRWYMPFVSNTVAHAINAGIIKEPSDIKVWAAAAKQAAQEI